MQILIVGAGAIAREYVNVVQDLGHQPIVVGYGNKNVDRLKNDYPGVKAESGGLENWLKHNQSPQHAIIATPINHLAKATRVLMERGCIHLLVEKPLTYNEDEALELANLSYEKGCRVNIAFNRRSYVSVQKAKQLIKQDGGVSSFHFDFTEATFRINPANYSEDTNRFWGMANSSHVIDTAFYLAGKPQWMESKQYEKAIDWHPAGSIFTGMGETQTGVPFTYHANWGCPGKWNIEIMTPARKLLFSPMERLHQQVKGGFKVELVDLDYGIDMDYKPGFNQQVMSWLQGEEHLMSLREFEEELKNYQKIFKY
jgi:predicted dehydrogenase